MTVHGAMHRQPDPVVIGRQRQDLDVIDGPFDVLDALDRPFRIRLRRRAGDLAVKLYISAAVQPMDGRRPLIKTAGVYTDALADSRHE